MATIQIYNYPLDMLGISSWGGTIVSKNASQINVSNPIWSGSYLGNFSYDAVGNISGTLTGYSESYYGGGALLISGLNVSAGDVSTLINSNQLPAVLQYALSGNDQFNLLYPGTHSIYGYGGYNTATEPYAHTSYTVTSTGTTASVIGSDTHDSFSGINGIYFADDFFYNIGTRSFSSPVASAGLVAVNPTTGVAAPGAAQTYSGPVMGVQHEFIAVTPQTLNISLSTDNWFVRGGNGADAIAVHGGTNVLDGGAGSNFLTGGNGFDTFFVDDRNAGADIWSTVVGFHLGDAATIWGVTAQNFNLAWVNGQGAAGFQGLTLHATAPGAPTASLTLQGFTTADLTNGRLGISYGSSGGSSYMYISDKA